MRFRQFEVFYSVMIAGSASGAAARLGVSQPSVTKTLQQLEGELGYQLFSRVKGRLQPTEEARALMREAERAQSALDDLRFAAKRLRLGAETHLRVAATPALGHEILPDAVAALNAEDPGLRFTISTRHSGEIMQEISKSAFGYDLGFVFEVTAKPDSVGARQIGEAPIACIGPPDTFSGKGAEIQLEDLIGKTLIGLDESEPLGRLVSEVSKVAGLMIDTPIRVQSYHLACAFARRGAGVAIVDAMTAVGYASLFKDVKIYKLPKKLSLPVNVLFPLARGLPVRSRSLVERFSQALDKNVAAFTSVIEAGGR